MVKAINKKKQMGSANSAVKMNLLYGCFLPLRDESKIQIFFLNITAIIYCETISRKKVYALKSTLTVRHFNTVSTVLLTQCTIYKTRCHEVNGQRESETGIAAELQRNYGVSRDSGESVHALNTDIIVRK